MLPRSFSFNRAKGRRRSGATWFGIQLASQRSRADVGRIVPTLLAEVRRALLTRGGLTQCDALFFEPHARNKLTARRLRESLEAGQPPAAVLPTASVSSLVGLLHLWIETLPEGLWSSVHSQLQ